MWRKRYEGRVGDLRKALDWCFGENGDPAMGIDLAIAAVRFWNEQSPVFEQLFQVGRALDRCMAIKGSELRQARLAESRGYTMTLARKPRLETEATWNTALNCAELSGDAGRLLSVMLGKAVFLIYCGRNAECMKSLDRFLTLARNEGDRGSLHDGERLATLANMHLGNLLQVRVALKRLAEDLAHGVPPSRTVRYQNERTVSINSRLAFLTWLTGDRERGLAMTEEVIFHLQTFDQPRAQSYVLAIVALPLALWSGQMPLLKRYLAILTKNLERENITLWEPAHRFFSAYVRHSEGDTQAIAVMRSAIKALIDDEILMRTPMYQGVLAEALLGIGKTIDAENALREAENLQVQTQEAWCLPELLRIKARILRQLGQHRAAHDVIAEARMRAELSGARSFEGRILEDMLRMAVADGDLAAASELRNELGDITDSDYAIRDSAPEIASVLSPL